MKTDPVCGMKVNEETPYTVEVDGEIYYFCSAGCAEDFQENTEEYIAPMRESFGE